MRKISIKFEKSLSPEVMIPPVIFLATQYSKGLTGASIVAAEWNEKHVAI